MKRLTIRRDHGVMMAEGFDFHIEEEDYDLVQEILDRLASYEDTGLEPEICLEYKTFEDEAVSKGVPFKRIVELMEADKGGRLVVLPCKVGDTVYQLFAPDGWKREPVIFMHALMSVEEVVRRMNKFGKTFFLTLEEAERALEGGGADG